MFRVLLLSSLSLVLYNGLSVLPASEAEQRQTLYLLTLLPDPDYSNLNLHPSWSEGPNIRPALELAKDLINNRSNVSTSYYLELVHADGGCEILSKTVVSFARDVFVEGTARPIVGIVGPGCSRSTIAVISLTQRQEISLVNIHDAGSPLLANRTAYRYSLGVFGSTRGFVNASLALIQRHSWNRIAVLYQESRDYYKTTFEELEDSLEKNLSEVKIAYSSAISSTFYPLSDIKEKRIRIIFVLSVPEHVNRIMCLAHHKGMLYPNFQWVLLGRQFGDIEAVKFTYKEEKLECSKQMLVTVTLNGVLLMSYRLAQVEKDSNTSVGLSFNKFVEIYQQRIDHHNSNLKTSKLNQSLTASIKWAPNLYDAVWAWAYVLDNITATVDMSEYKYGNNNITQLILKQFYTINFKGISGQIHFDKKSGFTFRVVDVYQVMEGEQVAVAYSNNTAGLTTVQGIEIAYIADTFPQNINKASVGLVAFFNVLLVVELVLTVTLQALTLKYRKHKAIKASSPLLNQFAYVGAYFLIAGLILYTLNEFSSNNKVAFTAMCQVTWAWLIPIGFSLILGTILVRTWRLYRIFVHYMDPGCFISNKALISFLCVIVSIDVLIGTVWTAVDPLELSQVEKRINNGHESFQVRCRCRGYFYWLTIVLSYKVVMLIMIGILTLFTRHISNRSFTTKSLQVLTYVMIITTVISWPMYYIFVFFGFDINIDFTIMCVFMNILLILLICCVFVCPFLPMVRDKPIKNQLLKSFMETSMHFL